MRGRYPAGLDECIEELDGESTYKQRLETILKPVCGVCRLFESCDALNVGETRYRQLRRQALQGALEAIMPKRRGRRRKANTAEAQRIRELEQLLAEKELQLQQALVREEVALILPRRAAAEEKKTQRPSVKLRKQKPR